MDFNRFLSLPIWEEEGGFLRVLLLGADLPKDQGCDYVWDIITCSMLDFIGRSVIVGSVVGMSDSFVCMDVQDFQTTLYPLISGFFYTRNSQDVFGLNFHWEQLKRPLIKLPRSNQIFYGWVCVHVRLHMSVQPCCSSFRCIYVRLEVKCSICLSPNVNIF